MLGGRMHWLGKHLRLARQPAKGALLQKCPGW